MLRKKDHLTGKQLSLEEALGTGPFPPKRLGLGITAQSLSERTHSFVLDGQQCSSKGGSHSEVDKAEQPQRHKQLVFGPGLPQLGND